jgi:hypothetical protein
VLEVVLLPTTGISMITKAPTRELTAVRVGKPQVIAKAMVLLDWGHTWFFSKPIIVIAVVMELD